jgi:hypothetical protein
MAACSEGLFFELRKTPQRESGSSSNVACEKAEPSGPKSGGSGLQVYNLRLL